MSAADTMMPFVSAPWPDTKDNPLHMMALPGLRSEVIADLERSYPGVLTPAMKAILGTCCGLARTELGSIDFTGCWFQEEPYAVFRPALTLAIDDADRRWIAEVGNQDLPGPIWCVIPDPEVAVRVCDDLAAFVGMLDEHARRDTTHVWLQGLSLHAGIVWNRRVVSAMRPHQAPHYDTSIRGWLLGLPPDAYIYDLRVPRAVRGWPYGVAGPGGRLYRCGRLPVFAVAGTSAEGWRAPRPRAQATPAAEQLASADVSFAIEASPGDSGHRYRSRPPRRWADKMKIAGNVGGVLALSGPKYSKAIPEKCRDPILAAA